MTFPRFLWFCGILFLGFGLLVKFWPKNELPDLTTQPGLVVRTEAEAAAINAAANADDPVRSLNDYYGSDTLQSRIRAWL
ncbi:MAG TPA: hypothetical protein VJB09_01040, partial [Candidatus Paceibacterota bacterium]